MTSLGKAYCWGNNQYGQLGDGTTFNRSLPGLASGEYPTATPFPSPSASISPTASRTSTASLTPTITLTRTATRTWTPLNTPTATITPNPAFSATPFFSATPTSTIPPGAIATDWTTLVANARTSCGVTAAGPAYCWGWNGEGQGGDGSTGLNRSGPVPVAGGYRWSSITVGQQHTCGITTDALAYCWGSNLTGQIGDGSSIYAQHLVPTRVDSDLTWAVISAGGAGHTCAITTEGDAYCWGRNYEGQLGDGTTTNRPVPAAVLGAYEWQAISAGNSHTCAVTTTGRGFCWGVNASGQFGDGTTTDSTTPVQVAGGIFWKSLTAGTNHTCGVTADGSAYCWGSNQSGQIGVGSTGGVMATPAAVNGGRRWGAISAGPSETCGVTLDGSGQCWGANPSGGLGNGSWNASAEPATVATTNSRSSLTVGSGHACGRTVNGYGYCWGLNDVGQVGDGASGTSNNRSTPSFIAVKIRGILGTSTPSSAWTTTVIPGYFASATPAATATLTGSPPGRVRYAQVASVRDSAFTVLWTTENAVSGAVWWSEVGSTTRQMVAEALGVS